MNQGSFGEEIQSRKEAKVRISEEMANLLVM
jgi:hypothetical protein